uniref:Uncharacterized protein n=1 Tax=Anopheles coluzzii TaxID=1518534 RepID=A0A8W7PRS3_ANOCL
MYLRANSASLRIIRALGFLIPFLRRPQEHSQENWDARSADDHHQFRWQTATASVVVVVSIFSVFAAILSRVYSLGSSESTSTTSFLGSAWIARFFGVDDFELGDCCLLGVASASADFSVRFGVVDAPRARLDGGVAVTAAVVGVAPRALDRVRRRPSSRSTETPSDFSSSSLSF